MLQSWPPFIFRLVQLAAVALFLGRAMEHLIWDAPFRALLWDEGWMKGLVENGLRMDWEAYITSEVVDERIQTSIRIHGWFYLCCALIAAFIRWIPAFLVKVLLIGAASLMILSFLYYKEKFFSIGQFLEYSLQFMTPVFLYQMYKGKPESKTLIMMMKIAIAITFTCHGLYAIGYYPQPGHFVQMVINILGVGEEQALFLLKVMGILDFIISILLFFPAKWARPALGYAVFWGLATSLARIVSSWDWTIVGDHLLQNLHECVLRFPHFLIPLVVYLMITKYNNQESLDAKTSK